MKPISVKIQRQIFLLLILTVFSYESPGQNSKQKPSLNPIRTRIKATEALSFCKSHHLNTNICILVDMSIHSGVNRLVVWDYSKRTTIHACLVSHGCCGKGGIWSLDRTKTNPRFSNIDGSHCSSLGKYRIGKRGSSQWGIGIKYLLHGLESTNSKALARGIYLHSWNDVPDHEVYPEGTPEGWGCPAVSPISMTRIDSLLRGRTIPVLLWVYN
jgi:hypothetical protein